MSAFVVVRKLETSTGRRGRKHSPETREKMRQAKLGSKRPPRSAAHREALRQANLGKKRSEETKRKIGDSKRGVKASEETKARMRASAPRKPRSEATKRKISEAHKGKPRSEETKQKLREANLGKKHSEEAKRNMSVAQRNAPPRKRGGWKQSEEFKRKVSERMKGRVSPMLGRKLSDETKRKISEAGKGKGGPGNWNWKGGITGGYVESAIPGKGRIRGHRHAVEEVIGRRLLPGEPVHHINGNKLDNRPENLHLCKIAQNIDPYI